MTAPTGPCYACKEPVLVVAMSTTTRSLEPQPDPTGTVEIRRSGLGYRGRPTGKNTPAHPGWVKHATHSCKELSA